MPEDTRFIHGKNFIGIEVEGLQRNIPTLFIANPMTTLVKLLECIRIASEYDIKRIYFGAGSTHILPVFITTAFIKKYLKNWRLVLECTPIVDVMGHPIFCYPGLYKIANMSSKLIEDPSKIVVSYPWDELKFEVGDHIFMIGKHERDKYRYSNMSNPLYQLDRSFS